MTTCPSRQKAGKVRVALIQPEVLRLQKETNQKRILALIDEAIDLKPDMIVLPETCDLGFPRLPNEETLESYRKEAETLKGPFVQELLSRAQKSQVHIYAGLVEKSEDDAKRLFNSAVFANPDGSLTTYRKVHQYQTEAYDECYFFEAGNKFGIVDAPFGRVGMQICFDTCFPEFARTLCFMGIDILVIGAAWPAVGGLRWEALIPARAVENQIYVVAANQAPGPEGEFYGNSMVVDYGGKILLRLERREQIGLVEIEPCSISAWRQQLPYLKMRRPDMYQLAQGSKE